jgi:serine/threonine-protein kinase
MAVVYRVIDGAKDGRALALKRLNPAAGDKAKLVHTLFEREYHALAQLAHPRVVEVHDYGVDEIGPYYTMELLDGSDLRELSPMPWKQLCSLMRDVCSALSLLHSRRLLHRDLTPRNVRVTSDGRAKLIDFGAMTPFGLAREVIGTPPHLAPEVVRGQPLDGRTDLYALGALFYWLLTGRHAYPARRASALDALSSRPCRRR